MMDKETMGKLVKEALEAREKAYAPYSHFRVGAALLTKGGRIYTGCNIENAAYGPSNCAERTAFFKALSEGEHSFRSIAIVGAGKKGNGQYAAPCGVCRQVMAEFCQPGDFEVIIANTDGEYYIRTLAELLPDGFGAANLDGEKKKGKGKKEKIKGKKNKEEKEKTEKDKAGKDSTGKERTEKEKTGKNKVGKEKTEKAGKDKAGKEKTEKAGKDETEEGKTGKDKVKKEKTGKDKPGKEKKEKMGKDKAGKEKDGKDRK